MVYFSLRYSFLPAIAAILKARKLYGGESKTASGVITLGASVAAFPEEFFGVNATNAGFLSFCSLKGVASELSGVYYLHFSGSPLNVL